jgi:hypothetical protein
MRAKAYERERKLTCARLQPQPYWACDYFFSFITEKRRVSRVVIAGAVFFILYLLHHSKGIQIGCDMHIMAIIFPTLVNTYWYSQFTYGDGCLEDSPTLTRFEWKQAAEWVV